MSLSDDQVKKIDEALSFLRSSLKDELEAGPEELKSKAVFNDAFIAKVADSYLSRSGVLALMADMSQDNIDGSGGCGGPCYITCVNPAKTACWGTGTVL
jgi:hypothetical protein